MKENHSARSPQPFSRGTSSTRRTSPTGSSSSTSAPSPTTSTTTPSWIRDSSSPGRPSVQMRTARPSGENPSARPTRSMTPSLTGERSPIVDRASTGPCREERSPIVDRASTGPCLRGFRGLLAGLLGSRLRHERGFEALLDGVLGHDALLDVATRGQLELHLEQRVLEDRAQAAGAGLALEGAVGDRAERVVGEDELDAVELEEALELLDERVARLGQDRDQVVTRELVDDRDDGQAPYELRDQAVLDEVLGQDLLEELPGVLVVLRADRRAEADALVPDPPLDHLVEVGEGTTADEQDVGGVDSEELLVRVLAPSLRRHRRDRSLEDL